MISVVVGSRSIVRAIRWFALFVIQFARAPLFVVKERMGLRDLCDLLYPRHFEKRRDSRLHSHLRFWCKILEALSTVRTIFEFSTIGLLDEPFSTVPTLHNWSDTHFSYLTSFRILSAMSSLPPSADLRATIPVAPPNVAIVRSKYIRGVIPSHTGPVRLRRLMLRMLSVTCLVMAEHSYGSYYTSS